VADLFRQHDIPRGALVLELTESVLVRDGSGAPERLNELHALGAQIAIDDFGIGYSSLSYLQDFPIDILKIDKSFVDHLGVDSAHGGALAHAVVSLAHSLRLEVVAEGIERVEQRDELWSLGCGLGQGYLYARPMTAKDLGPLLAVRGPLGPPGPRAARGNLARLRKPVPAQTPAAESV